MGGAIYVYIKDSVGKVDCFFTLETKNWPGLDEGLSDVIRGGIRLTGITGEEREFNIGEAVVFLFPKRDTIFVLVLDRRITPIGWKERFKKIARILSKTRKPAHSKYESAFQEFFTWITTAFENSEIERVLPPSSIPSYKERKLLLIGLSKAGKTSIVKRFFEQETLENSMATKPTVLSSVKRSFVSFLTGNVLIHDLGGQKEFRPHHLANPGTFKSLLALLYVIDLQDKERFSTSLDFFKDVLERVRETRELGFVSVFLHKYDPKLRTQLLEKLTEIIIQILDAASGFPLVFYPTSIFDDSLSKAIIRTLFYALPGTVFEQALTSERLLSIHQHLDRAEDPEKAALKEGYGRAEDLLRSWINWAGGLTGTTTGDENIVQLSFENGNVLFRLKCPVAKTMRSEQCCLRTSQMLAGLCQALGLNAPVPYQPENLNESEYCHFLANK